ncbi:MAG: Low iron-inducible periplasmic protein-domain-containing protein [Monoraphidium minutum]|nr:MAG: Low iron-inducible periplasmic protein-domain-containing protein [Monoraphidium minutum]
MISGRAPAAAAALLLLALAAGAARAQAPGDDTTGQQLQAAPGYTFGSNVAGYLKVSNDVCDFKAALDKSPPDWAAAKALYLDGKNSRRSDGSVRTLRSLATGSYVGEPFWDLYTEYFQTPAFADDAIIKALDGTPPFVTDAQRRETAGKAVESNLQMAYLMHEMDEAADKIRDNLLSDATGAPHNVDEVFALYVGEKPECGLWTVSTKRATDFGTMQTCAQSEVNANMLKAFRDAQAAARAGDLPAFLRARDAVQALFAVTYTQATLKYAYEVERDRVAKKPTDEHQAEGYAFFRTIEPLVARANKSSAATVQRIMFPGNAVVPGGDAQVAAAMRAAYPGLQITPAAVGTFEAKQNLGCVNATSAARAALNPARPFAGRRLCRPAPLPAGPTFAFASRLLCWSTLCSAC